MDKLIYKEKTARKEKVIMMYALSGLMLFLGIVIFAFVVSNYSALSDYSGGMLIFLFAIFLILDAGFNFMSAFNMNKAYVAVYENHVEGIVYYMIFTKGFSVEYSQITEIQRDMKKSITISTISNKYTVACSGAEKVYNILMEQWKSQNKMQR